MLKKIEIRQMDEFLLKKNYENENEDIIKNSNTNTTLNN